MAAPEPIKLQIPQTVQKTSDAESALRELQKVYNDIQRLKAEIDTIKTRLFNASIP